MNVEYWCEPLNNEITFLCAKLKVNGKWFETDLEISIDAANELLFGQHYLLASCQEVVEKLATKIARRL